MYLSFLWIVFDMLVAVLEPNNSYIMIVRFFFPFIYINIFSRSGKLGSLEFIDLFVLPVF